jgi:hypothetical protein
MSLACDVPECLHGVTGRVDAPRVKRALEQADAPLVLVISDEIYSGIVCHGYAHAGGYLPLAWVRVAGRRHRGWVHVPAPAAGLALGSGPAGTAGPAALALVGEPARYPAAAVAGGDEASRAG